MADTNLSNLIVNLLTRKAYHTADLTDHGNELFVQSDHAGVHVGASGVDGLDTTNIANCITETSQDINLELNNGTLTLKAGSKFYLPNGVNVFDAHTSSNNHSTTNSNNGVHVVFSDSVGNLDAGYPLSRVGSGATLPANNNDFSVFYNTTDGKIYTWQTNQFKVRPMSLPIAIITISGGQITSIDQVFNGFGYVGSTVFALPGVKGLAPDGRNTDGTLKNAERTATGVSTISSSATGTFYVAITSSGELGWSAEISRYVYDESTNHVIDTQTGSVNTNLLATIVTLNSGSITSFTSKTAFHAVDYNDAAVKAGNNTFTGSNEFKETVKAPRVYGYGSDGVRTASLEFIDGGNDNMARLVAVSNNGGNAATADLHFNNGSPYFSVPSSDAVNAAVATLAKTKAQNGYFKLSNGLIIQWGTTSDNVTNRDYTINFPTAFSSTNYSFAGACIGQQNEDALCIITQNTANIVIQARSFNAGSVNKPYSWIAIGY